MRELHPQKTADCPPARASENNEVHPGGEHELKHSATELWLVAPFAGVGEQDETTPLKGSPWGRSSSFIPAFPCRFAYPGFLEVNQDG